MKRGGGDLLTVQDLHKWFPIKGGMLRRTVGHLRAVDGVSFSVMKGETPGVVGESGCGKTTLAKTVMKLIADEGKDNLRWDRRDGPFGEEGDEAPKEDADRLSGPVRVFRPASDGSLMPHRGDGNPRACDEQERKRGDGGEPDREGGT